MNNLVATSREPYTKKQGKQHQVLAGNFTLDRASGAGLTVSSKADGTSSKKRIMHPALKMAFEAAYPSKHIPTTGTSSTSTVPSLKIQGLVQKDCFEPYFDAAVQQPEANRGFQPAATSLFQRVDFAGEGGEDVLKNPCFQSIPAAAQEFDVL
ncbi:hypothetical protein N657DRAFT_688946 [Parathielavia appendiculata]|uniref:Uncharacterized protein n=1 Tax=Parathielavia appendiculata TaxID=2587402 RepID=A0AAN6U4P3_9PEZI|nr:hypothetical protein N657DRAFT_688946 [Parathielavia appendiculata]